MSSDSIEGPDPEGRYTIRHGDIKILLGPEDGGWNIILWRGGKRCFVRHLKERVTQLWSGTGETLRKLAKDIGRMSEDTGLKEDEAFRILNRFAAEISERLEAHGLDSQPKPPSEEHTATAQNILAEGNPLVFIIQTVQKVHKGDRVLIAVGVFSGLSVWGRSTIQLHWWPIGGSQKGKSHLVYSILLLIPEEWFIQPLTSATAKSLHYVKLKYGDDYLNGKIIFFDEVEASKETTPLLRTLTSQTKIKPRHLSVDTQSRGAEKVLDLGIKGKHVVWFTSVNLLPDEQLQNRFKIGNVDETAEQDERVFQFQDMLYRRGKEAESLHQDFDVSKALLQIVAKETREVDVEIPYGVDWPFKEQRQLYPMFLEIVKECTKLFFKRRRKTVEGNLVATYSDFLIACLLWLKHWKVQMKKIPAKALELLRHIPDNAGNAKSRRELANDTGWSTATIKRYATYLEAALQINSGKRNGRGEWEYWKQKENSLSSTKLQANWGPLEKWIEEKAGMHHEKKRDAVEEKVVEWSKYVRDVNDAKNFYDILTEHDKKLFWPTDETLPVTQEMQGKSSPVVCSAGADVNEVSEVLGDTVIERENVHPAYSQTTQTSPIYNYELLLGDFITRLQKSFQKEEFHPEDFWIDWLKSQGCSQERAEVYFNELKGKDFFYGDKGWALG